MAVWSIGLAGVLYGQQGEQRGIITDFLSFFDIANSYTGIVCPQEGFSYPLVSLNRQEVDHGLRRTAWVKKYLAENHQITGRAPKIAVCISGGGVRALVGGLGFLKAMQEEGFLECSSYLCGLSGSTWGISGLLESKVGVGDYLEFLKMGLQVGFFNGIDGRKIGDELLKKVENGQSVSLIDIWGVLIAEKILANSRNRALTSITLSNYMQLPQDGSSLMPIYSCVTPLGGLEAQTYQWVEWTPFEVSCPYLKTAIPLWALGRTFKEGKSIDMPAPLSLSFGLGVWGSVMSGNIQDLLKVVMNPLLACEGNLLACVLPQLDSNSFFDQMSRMRAFPAKLPNWNWQLEGAPACDCQTLTFVDAAFLCNLPLIPALNPLREVDIIIAVDLTIGDDFVLELPCTATYAADNGLPFPPINPDKLRNICSVYGAEDARVPTIVYFPLVANQDYMGGWDPQTADFTGTLNVTYTPAQVDLVSGLMYTACKQNSFIIWDLIKKAANR
jgi:phospholipase A2